MKVSKKYVVYAIQVYDYFGMRLAKPMRAAWSFSNKSKAIKWRNSFKRRPGFSTSWMEEIK